MADEKEVKTNLVAGNEQAELMDAEVLDDSNTMKLQKPLPNGRGELIFNFDRINGYVLMRCEKLAKKEDPSITTPILAMPFQAHIAAKACGIKYDDVLSLAAPDFMAVTRKVLSFLTSAVR